MLGLIVLGLVACGDPPDPEFVALGQVVAQADAGEDALADGRPAEALAAFDAARARRPEDALLHAWAGRAALAAGDPAGAVERLDRALAAAPSLAAARTLRARAHLALGHPELAVADLRQAIADGDLTPRTAVADPDFGALRGRDDAPFLPEASVSATWRVPDGTVLVGTEVDVVLEIRGPWVPEALGDGPYAGAALVRVVEDVTRDPLGDTVRTLSWTLRPQVAGSLAPGAVDVEGVGAVAWPAPIEVVAAGLATEQAATWTLPVPSARLGARVPPVVWRDGDGAWAAVPGGGRVEVQGGRVVGRPWRVSDDGVARFELVPLPAEAGEVRLRVGRDVVWTGPVP